MGMILEARMLTEQDVADVLSSPERLEELVEEHDDADDRVVDVDKAWHGIHWLLTGSADLAPPPAKRRLFRRAAAAPAPTGAEAWAVLGGEPLSEDAGYGPARLLRPDEVAAVAAALEPLDRVALGARVDLPGMAAADLYPQIWDEDDVYDEDVGPNYEVLRDFYRRAAAEGAAVLLSIS